MRKVQYKNSILILQDLFGLNLQCTHFFLCHCEEVLILSYNRFTEVIVLKYIKYFRLASHKAYPRIFYSNVTRISCRITTQSSLQFVSVRPSDTRPKPWNNLETLIHFATHTSFCGQILSIQTSKIFDKKLSKVVLSPAEKNVVYLILGASSFPGEL